MKLNLQVLVLFVISTLFVQAQDVENGELLSNPKIQLLKATKEETHDPRNLVDLLRLTDEQKLIFKGILEKNNTEMSNIKATTSERIKLLYTSKPRANDVKAQSNTIRQDANTRIQSIHKSTISQLLPYLTKDQVDVYTKKFKSEK